MQLLKSVEELEVLFITRSLPLAANKKGSVKPASKAFIVAHKIWYIADNILVSYCSQ
jgi:hypothetical protein